MKDRNKEMKRLDDGLLRPINLQSLHPLRLSISPHLEMSPSVSALDETARSSAVPQPYHIRRPATFEAALSMVKTWNALPST